MSNVEARLRELGIELEECPAPIGLYVPAVVAGDLIFLSGQTAFADGELKYAGRVGADISIEEGALSARLAALCAISELKTVADLDKVRIVKLTGFVNAVPGFGDQPKVINGASKLFEHAFGENGRHARSAIGVASLPRNASVEIEVIAQFIK